MVKAGSTVSKVIQNLALGNCVLIQLRCQLCLFILNFAVFLSFIQVPGVPLGPKQTQSKEQCSSSSSREIEKVGGERDTGGEKKMVAGGSKKEENVRLTAKEGKIRLPGKEEIFYRSWEEGNESDPWVVIDLKIVKK